MNKTVCWMCSKEFSYEGEKYQDVICCYCLCQNSIYDPKDYKPYEPNGSENKGEEDMKPPVRPKTEFEKVAIGEFVTGVIEKIKYDQEHKFTFQGKETITPAVQFVFTFDGYNFPHYSRWYRFNLGEKSNLYKIYLVKLVENIIPDADFDLDHLIGMKVKTIWQEQNDFQGLESIYPLEGKILFTTEMASQEPHEEEITEEQEA